MNFYAKQLHEGRMDVPIEVRYAILCQMIANDPDDTKEDLIALTAEYEKQKGRRYYEPIRSAVSE